MKVRQRVGLGCLIIGIGSMGYVEIPAFVILFGVIAVIGIFLLTLD